MALRIPRVREMKADGSWASHYISAPGLVEPISKLPDPVKGIEIGVAAGENICYMLDNCPNIRHITAIDPWTPYTDCNGTGTAEIVKESHAVTIDNFQDYASRVTIYRCTSDEYIKGWGHEHEAYDYVFIDGNHDYEYVKRDIENFYPLIRKGGFICGHDIGLASVQKALNEFLMTLSYKPQVHTCDVGAWYFMKEDGTTGTWLNFST